MMTAIVRTCQTRTASSTISVASRNITAAITSWVTRIRRFLSSLSANTPPNRLKAMAGIALASPT